MATSILQYGTNNESLVLIEHGFRDAVFDREPRDGSEWSSAPSGVEDSWLTGLDFTMASVAQYLPYSSDPSVTTPLGHGFWQGFLDWVRAKNTFRFVPDASNPSFYVDGCYWVEPIRGGATPRTPALSDFRFKIRHPTQDLLQMMRGIMFEYAPDFSLTDPLAFSITRATAATRRGVPSSLFTPLGASDLAGVLRNRHYVVNTKTTLFEELRVQLTTQPENIGAWTDLAGTPVLTSGQADPFGGTNGWLVADDNAAVCEIRGLTVAFTGDGTKSGLFAIKQGDAFPGNGRVQRVRLRDQTAAVNRFSIDISAWVGGVPTFAISGGTLLGGPGGTLINLGAGWWGVPFQAAGIVAANTNQWQICPADTVSGSEAEVGSIRVFGFNAWNAEFPTSYQGPSLTTRNADAVSAPFPWDVQAVFMYTRYYEMGQRLGAASRGLTMLGTNAGTRLINFYEGNAAFPRTLFDNGLGTQVRSPSGSITGPAQGDLVEVLNLLYGDGSVAQEVAYNGGAPTISARSAANPSVNQKFNTSVFTFLLSGTPTGLMPLAHVKVGVMSSFGLLRDTLAKARAA